MNPRIGISDFQSEEKDFGTNFSEKNFSFKLRKSRSEFFVFDPCFMFSDEESACRWWIRIHWFRFAAKIAVQRIPADVIISKNSSELCLRSIDMGWFFCP